MGLGMTVQFLAFLIGVIYIGGHSLYIVIKKKETRLKSIKMIFFNYLYYLMAYLVLNIISVAWGLFI